MGAEEAEQRSTTGHASHPARAALALCCRLKALSAKRAPHRVSHAQELAQRGLTLHSHCVNPEHSYPCCLQARLHLPQGSRPGAEGRRPPTAWEFQGPS